MKIFQFSTDDQAWRDILEHLPHDIYHLPEYARVEARRMGGEATALLACSGHDRLLLPLVLLPTTIAHEPWGTSRDAVSPYGYPTLLVQAPPERASAFTSSALASLREHLAQQGVAALFMRGHPLIPFDEEALAGQGAVLAHGQTVWMDLTQSEESLWGQVRPRFRSYLRRLENNGLTVETDMAFRHYDRFMDLYRQTMTHVGAVEWYFFDQDYFEGLRAALGTRLTLMTASTQAGEIISAALFTECDGIVQYHLSGTDKSQQHQDALKLLIHRASRHFKQLGNRALHLGGGLGAAEDPLFQFKAGFSKLRASFKTWRTVCDPFLYEAACAEWQRRSGLPIAGLDGFFPPYRRKMPSS